MTAGFRDVFADTAFWIALVVKQDGYHERAEKWSLRITGTITTTSAVLLETANALSRPAWRTAGTALIEHLQDRSDVVIVGLTGELWKEGWDLYRNRQDKAWSLTDCISFQVMQQSGLTESLTTDEHFRQAGFHALLLEVP